MSDHVSFDIEMGDFRLERFQRRRPAWFRSVADRLLHGADSVQRVRVLLHAADCVHAGG